MQKIYDIVATVGTYTDRSGQEKRRYKNVGAVLKGEKGPFMMLDKTFNPAGLAEAQRDSILLSLFEPKTKGDDAEIPEHPARDEPISDDIPF